MGAAAPPLGGALPVPPARRRRGSRGIAPALAVLWAVVIAFILYPLARLTVRVFTGPEGPTLAHVQAVGKQWITWAAFNNSLLLAAAVGTLGTVLGVAFAFFAARADVPRAVQRLLDIVVLLPLVSPPFTAAIAIILVLGPKGLISKYIGDVGGFSVYGLPGTILSETLTYFPLAYLTMKGVLANIDRSIEDAAYSLGARRLRVFLTITLPLATPGIANSFLLVSGASLADFATPLVLGSTAFPVLPTQAFLQITGLYDIEGGATLALLLLFPALGVYLAQRYWVGERSYVVVTGKTTARRSLRSVSTPAKLLLAAVCACVIAFVVLFYGVILATSLVRAFGADNTPTLQHYLYVFTRGMKAVTDTLIIAGLSMPIGGLFAVVLGYLIVRFRFRGRRTLEFAAMLNYALPGTIVGIAYLVSFNDPPFELTGGLAILVICYVFRYSLAGMRGTTALLHQVDKSIEEASGSLGANRIATFRRIVLPLVLPALAAGMTVLFIRAMTAISATIFLVSVKWSLVTVRILEGITNVELGQASAFSIIVILIVFLAVAVMNLVLRLLGASRGQQAGALFSG
ncbi:MAG: iron ABC transporter permease [Burkholderiales bacterium]|nr:iron ABC transporter permease [Burkholderiales bacterium]